MIKISFWIAMLFVAIFFAGAHFGSWLEIQRMKDPHFLRGDDTEDTDLRNCLLGDKRYCDKMDIEKTYNQLLQRAEEWNGDIQICFANGTLMNKFLEQNPEGHFNITVPCPPLDTKNLQPDESGK